jgi:hypothetical protein
MSAGLLYEPELDIFTALDADFEFCAPAKYTTLATAANIAVARTPGRANALRGKCPAFVPLRAAALEL